MKIIMSSLSILQDNCPFISNTYQQDFDNDQVGDICDNCEWDHNTYQEDTDKDGKGDVCDPDIDNDGMSSAIEST